MTHTFEVENIKCGGCMSSIRKGLEQMPGVLSARPDNTNGTVEVDFEESVMDEKTIADKLADMGYPLSGENTLGRKAKSYVSCMVGRLS
ncbi:MAG: heavy-metal-associated domain-containing protein [Saprospiraceae bacterium]|nr:heavy-metal-associated domain-containing protein [Saprospiraceae bacterium]